MGASVVQARFGTGASVTWASAEGGVSFSLDDSISGITPVPIPTVTGTNYSWIRNLVLYVTATGTTTISNRRIALSGTPATGLNIDWKAVAVASYVQASGASRPTASGSNGAVAAGYTLATTTAAVYDASSVATSSTGPNGLMAVCVTAGDLTYTAGPSSAATVSTILLLYDEQ